MIAKAHHPRVLVVDDMKEMRVLISKSISREGIEVHEAPGGVVAMNVLRTSRFDLVTVDLQMPGENGHKLVTDILSLPRPALVVVITGVTDARIAKDLFKRGVSDVVYKPFDIDLLGTKICTLIERRSAQVSAKAAGLTDQIASASSALQNQLESIQRSFQDTIASLEKQRDQMESDLLGSVRMLTSIVEQVGASHGSHPVRVEKLAGALGVKQGLSTTQQRDLKVAALLHEIGLFGMPDSIRNKPPAEMSPEDREVFHKYPTVGALLLGEIPGLSRVVPIVANHAEHFDGSGFPAGIEGDMIPIEARILAIADGVDTLGSFETSHDWVEFLARKAGKNFDPELAKMAMGCFRELQNGTGDASVKRPVKTAELRVGQKLADTLFDERGLMLVRADTELTSYAIEQIRKLVPGATVSIYADQG